MRYTVNLIIDVDVAEGLAYDPVKYIKHCIMNLIPDRIGNGRYVTVTDAVITDVRIPPDEEAKP